MLIVSMIKVWYKKLKKLVKVLAKEKEKYYTKKVQKEKAHEAIK